MAKAPAKKPAPKPQGSNDPKPPPKKDSNLVEVEIVRGGVWAGKNKEYPIGAIVEMSKKRVYCLANKVKVCEEPVAETFGSNDPKEPPVSEE